MVEWNDTEMLARVIEERFSFHLGTNKSTEEIWREYFVAQIDNVSTKSYIMQVIIPRPRDIIYFCRSALASAINSNHKKIDAVDLKKAEFEYSAHAFDALVTELLIEYERIEEVLVGFAGSNQNLSRNEVETIVADTIQEPEEIGRIIELLVDFAFLGLETSRGQFQFLYNERRKSVLHQLARTTARESGVTLYSINRAYHCFLSIEMA